ncbi:hypothetical protein JOE11_002287 [Robbsia andropogonis]
MTDGAKASFLLGTSANRRGKFDKQSCSVWHFVCKNVSDHRLLVSQNMT